MPSDACRCTPPYGTGQSYFGSQLCMCGGLITSSTRLLLMERERAAQRIADFNKNRKLPKHWRPAKNKGGSHYKRLRDSRSSS